MRRSDVRHINRLQRYLLASARIWLGILLLVALMLPTAHPASADGPVRAEGTHYGIATTTVVLEFDPSGGPVTGTVHEEQRYDCLINNEKKNIGLSVDGTISGVLNGNDLSGTVSATGVTMDSPCPYLTSHPGTISIEGTFDFGAGTGSGTLADDSRDKWQVTFLVLQADFEYDPPKPRPGDKITFMDTTKNPSGDQLKQTWYVDGKESSTESQFTWQAPDAKAHKVKLVVTAARGTTAEVEKTVEPEKFGGQVVAVELAGPKPLAGVVVYATLPDGKTTTATTDKDGKFEMDLPALSGEGALQFSGLSIPPGGNTPWLFHKIYYPLRKTVTVSPGSTDRPELEVPAATIVLHVSVEGPSGPAPAEAMPTSLGVRITPGGDVYKATWDRSNRTIELPVLAAGWPGGSTIRPEGLKALNLDEKMPMHLLANFGDGIYTFEYQVSSPSGVQRQDYELVVPTADALLEGIRNRVRAAIIAALAGRPDAEKVADGIVSIPLQPNSGGDTSYLNGVISLTSDLASQINSANGRETLAHEYFHALQDQILHDSRSLNVGGPHDIGKPSNPDMAFDEGRAAFFAYLIQAKSAKEGEVAQKTGAYPRLLPIEELPALNQGMLIAQTKKLNVDGSLMEGDVTIFLVDFYGQDVDKKPDEVFKDFYLASQLYKEKHGNPPSTVLEFIKAKEEAGSKAALGDPGRIDEIAARYGIKTDTNGKLVPQVDLKKVPATGAGSGTDGSQGLKVTPATDSIDVQAPPGSKGGTVPLPSTQGGAPGSLGVGPNTGGKLDTGGISAVPSQRGQQQFLVDTHSLSGFSVKSGPHVAIPQQTRYAVSLDPDGTFTLYVLEGAVTLADIDAGVSLEVPAGKQAQTKPDGLPVLIALDLSAPAARWWEAIPGNAAEASDTQSWAWFLTGAVVVAAGVLAVRRRAGHKPRLAPAPGGPPAGGPVATRPVEPVTTAPTAAATLDAPPVAVESPPSSTPAVRHCGCGGELLPEARFCPTCGAPVTPAAPTAAFCYKCGQPLVGDARFCAACGTPAPISASALPAHGPVVAAQSVLPVAAPPSKPAEADAVRPAARDARKRNGLLFLCAFVATVLTIRFPMLFILDVFLIVILWRGGARKSAVFMGLLSVVALLVATVGSQLI